MQGLITATDRDIILEGLDQIERLIQEGKFEWRKDREDVHMNIEAALIERVGEPAKKLHTARSRNDQIVTDLRLWCRDAIDKILIRIKQLQVCSRIYSVMLMKSYHYYVHISFLSLTACRCCTFLFSAQLTLCFI
jgi:argininosuccinate lyase